MSAIKTVLIIDDDAQFRRLMSEILQARGWAVIEAAEGEAGLADARKHRPDVVLCDLLMPRCNGFQFCRTIREDAGLKSTKIIVTSGRDYAADRNSARQAGADEYLTKPIQPDALVKLLERLGTGASPTASRPTTPAAANDSPARIKFWGVRGSIPSPGPDTVRFGGNTSCVEVRAGGEIIILDAGTGLRPLGRELMAKFNGEPLNLTLLLTHTHWDHIQGLPFFRPIYQPECRLRILGYEGARRGLVNVLSGQMESPYFPVLFDELPGNVQIEELKDMEFHVGCVRVQAWFANHPGICVGYRMFTDEGSVAYFPDNEPYTRLHQSPPVPTADARAAADYASTQEDKMVEFLRGTDALILDSQFDADEYRNHVGWGHGCVDSAVALAVKAGVGKLFLFHHDPDHNDAKVESMVAHARKLVAEQNATLQVDAAREGMAVELASLACRATEAATAKV
jgi:phosphoribosyl 1,2-cyclic phosphodiesterase/ActR/RegA family two-component response regulator